MPKINLTINHALGADEAKQRIQRLVADTRNDFGHLISDVQESWAGYVETYSFRAAGFAVKGTIQVDATAVHIEMHYPLAAIPFKRRIEADLLKHATELLKS